MPSASWVLIRNAQHLKSAVPKLVIEQLSFFLNLLNIEVFNALIRKYSKSFNVIYIVKVEWKQFFHIYTRLDICNSVTRYFTGMANINGQ